MNLFGIYTLCIIQLTCDLSLNRPFLPYVLFRSLSFTETVGSSMYDLIYVTEVFLRAGIMYTTENGELNQQLKSSMFSLSGTGFFGAVGRSINLGLYLHHGYLYIREFFHLESYSISSML